MGHVGNVGRMREGKNMNKTSRSSKRTLSLKVLSFALAFVLVVGMLPAVALGNGEEQAIESQQQEQLQTQETETPAVVDKTVSFVFDGAYAVIDAGMGEQIHVGSTLNVAEGANLTVKPAANEGYTISSVYASSSAYPNNDYPLNFAADGSFTLAAENFDSSLTITIVGAPAEQAQTVAPQGEEVTALGAVVPLAEKEVTLDAFTSIGDEQVLTGDTREITYSFVGKGVEAVIIAIPVSSHASLRATTEIVGQTVVDNYEVNAGEATTLGIPAGTYKLVAIPFDVQASTASGFFTFIATCENFPSSRVT